MSKKISKRFIIVMDLVNTFNKNPLKYIRVNTLSNDTHYNWKTVKSWIKLLSKEGVLNCQQLNNKEDFDEIID